LNKFFELNEEKNIDVNGYLIENKNQNISSESTMGIELIKADNFRLKKNYFEYKKLNTILIPLFCLFLWMLKFNEF
jgi:hypothetical protein